MSEVSLEHKSLFMSKGERTLFIFSVGRGLQWWISKYDLGDHSTQPNKERLRGPSRPVPKPTSFYLCCSTHPNLVVPFVWSLLRLIFFIGGSPNRYSVSGFSLLIEDLVWSSLCVVGSDLLFTLLPHTGFPQVWCLCGRR